MLSNFLQLPDDLKVVGFNISFTRLVIEVQVTGESLEDVPPRAAAPYIWPDYVSLESDRLKIVPMNEPTPIYDEVCRD